MITIKYDYSEVGLAGKVSGVDGKGNQVNFGAYTTPKSLTEEGVQHISRLLSFLRNAVANMCAVEVTEVELQHDAGMVEEHRQSLLDHGQEPFKWWED